MKRNKKKLTAVFLGTALACSVLAGCGTNETTSQSASSITGTVQTIDSDRITLKTDSPDQIREIKITDSTTIKRQTPEPPQSSGDPSAQETPQDNGGDSTLPEIPQDNGNGSTPPEIPQNNADGSAPPEPPQGNGSDAPAQPPQETGTELTVSDISIGDTITITLNDDGSAKEIALSAAPGEGGAPGNAPGGMGQDSAPDSYQAVHNYTSDAEENEKELSSAGTDENAVYVHNDANVTLNNCTISRKSADSTGGDSSSFYGVGAAILATDGTVSVNGGTIVTDAAGGAGLFAYGNAEIHAANTEIHTTQDTSGGIHAAGGGTVNAQNLVVETQGDSSAAIRSDRGGGTMVIDGGSYTSNGSGSPAIYSTADITATDAKLTATRSEAVCIEGKNSIRLTDCDLEGNMEDNIQNDCIWNVILYQSMSGDSEVGNSTFEMTGGTLTARNGGMFYTTNTQSTITLSGVDITYADNSAFFLRCTGNNNKRDWGKSGENGADCRFTSSRQEMKGDIIWDNISRLDFQMKDGSSLTGAVQQDNSCAGSSKTNDGACNLSIASGCTWTVTGDSTLSSLSCEGKILGADGKSVTIRSADGTLYKKGDSRYTVTVSSYQDTI